MEPLPGLSFIFPELQARHQTQSTSFRPTNQGSPNHLSPLLAPLQASHSLPTSPSFLPASISLPRVTSSPVVSVNEEMPPHLPTLASLAQLASTQEAVTHEQHVRPARQPSSAPRKKKKRAPEEEVGLYCHNCGNTKSVEWRRGPDGPKTLCNACGLRWAKQIKQEKQIYSIREVDRPTDKLASLRSA